MDSDLVDGPSTEGRPDAAAALAGSTTKGGVDFRELANVLPEIIWTCDAWGRLEWVNDRWMELTGLSAEQTLNDKGALVAVHADDREDLQRRFAQALATSSACELEYRIRRRDGEYRYHFGRLQPVRNQAGAISHWVAAVLDMDDRRQAEEALRAAEAALRQSEALARARADELAALMDAVPAAVWIAEDTACREVRGNRTGRAILRMEEGNLSKTALDPAPTQHFKVFADGREVHPLDLPLQRAARGEEVKLHEEQVHFDDGKIVHLYGSAVPLRAPGGAPRGSIGVFVDVTRLKQAEAAMRAADRRKDDFLALLSHELRNPLAPILTAAQLLQLRGDAATQREREIIIRQVHHLVRLVDDLLDVSRVARGKIKLAKRSLEIAGVVAKAVEATAPLLEQRGHRLELAVPAEGLLVDADEVRLVQIISNLLTNAARYTPPGGRIDVTAAREGGDVVLRVRDDGAGIDPALLPHVFEMFVQGGRGLDRAQGGLGLGLSLVQTLTGLHNGTVEAKSDGPGHGSEFTVRLPAAAAPVEPVSAAEQDERRAAAARGQRRVLVVDDNRDGAQMVGDLLAHAGYEIRLAGDASEALAIAQGFRPEVAILDIGLPTMDGYALARELRALMSDGPPILIALTGYGQEQDRRRSADAGFTLHLVKPVDPDKLTHVVDALVGNS
jgi:PAS domain S-box-containing protein